MTTDRTDSYVPGTPWLRGREDVLELISEGRVEKVAPDSTLAQRILDRAANSLVAAQTLLNVGLGADAFEKAYSGARLAATAFLEQQGLRVSGRDGAHATVGDLVAAQLGKRLGSELQHLRHLRNDTEYPRPGKDVASVDEAREAITYAQELLAAVRQLMETVGVFR